MVGPWAISCRRCVSLRACEKAFTGLHEQVQERRTQSALMGVKDDGSLLLDMLHLRGTWL